MLIKKGEVLLSVRLKFKSASSSRGVTTLGRWKVDMDESTENVVRLGSVREVILATLSHDDVYSGSEYAPPANLLKGDWDLGVEIFDADTQLLYSTTVVKNIVKNGNLTI